MLDNIIKEFERYPMRAVLALVLGFALLEVVGIFHAMIGQPLDMPHTCNQFEDWINLCR